MKKDKGRGVDIGLGQKCSDLAYGWAKKTFGNRASKLGFPIMRGEGSFSNLLDFGDVGLGIASDGIGTKVEVAERTGKYDTLGHDLVAMVVDDLAANGFEPVNISNVLDVDTLDYDVVDQLMRGIHDAAGLAGVAVTGGEIAELGDRIGGFGKGMHFNWCATAIGVLRPKARPVDGSKIAAGDAIVALESSGFRCNGFTLVRSIMNDVFGPDWHRLPYDRENSWGQVILTPSIIYSPLVQKLLDAETEISGIAHITGGGIPGNLGRVLKKARAGATLHNLFDPQPFVRELHFNAGLAREMAYERWNMGNGMLLIMAEDQVDKCLYMAEENNFNAQVAGRVTREPTISIVSKGRTPWKLDFEVS